MREHAAPEVDALDYASYHDDAFRLQARPKLETARVRHNGVTT